MLQLKLRVGKYRRGRSSDGQLPKGSKPLLCKEFLLTSLESDRMSQHHMGHMQAASQPLHMILEGIGSLQQSLQECMIPLELPPPLRTWRLWLQFPPLQCRSSQLRTCQLERSHLLLHSRSLLSKEGSQPVSSFQVSQGMSQQGKQLALKML
jgi:hypothetical protein